MNINELKPEDVIKPEHLQDYNELHDDIYGRIVKKIIREVGIPTILSVNPAIL